MRQLFWFLVALLLVCQTTNSFAQTPQQLRQQLEELQKKLDVLEREPEVQNRRVTEIGATRSKPREDLPPPLVTRIYDLSDLFAVAPPYAAKQPSIIGNDEPVFFNDGDSGKFARTNVTGAGGLGGGGLGGGGGGGFFSVPSSIAGGSATLNQNLNGSHNSGVRTTLDQLIDTIKTTIVPDEWKTGRASIAVIGASLVIAAPNETHAQVSSLLDLFRKRWGSLRTVSMRAWWIWLTESQLTAALADSTKTRKGPAAFGALSADAWAKLKDAADEADRPGYEAAITCYNGQTVHTLAGDHRLVVTGLIPSVSGEGSAAITYEPTLTTLQEGAVLQITPIVTRTAKFLVLDVHSRVNLIQDAAPPARPEKIDPSDPALITSAIERPILQTQRISTTLRVPVDTPTLIGGMTFGNIKGQNLYLIVQGVVQELRDEEPSEAAGPAGSRP